jgi:DNA invertase Pin-like site-specific DNA recombinase
VQEGLIRQKAEGLPGQVMKVHVDEAISGRVIRWDERDGFRALMEVVGSGDHLVIWRLDRIDRQPFAMLDAIRWLVERGLSIHVLDQWGMELDLGNSMGRKMVMFWAILAEFFIGERSEAAREASRWRKERRLSYSRLPLGMRRRKVLLPDPKRPGKQMEESFDVWDPQDCTVIREIWRRHELEGETLYAVAKSLRARKACRADGRPWVPDGCRRPNGSGKRYPFSPRTVQRAFWKYTAMLAAGKDLEDLAPTSEHVKIAQARIREHRVAWSRKGRPGRLPSEARRAIEQNALGALSNVTPRSWQKRSYPGPGQ